MPGALGPVYAHSFSFGGRRYAVRTQPTTSYLEQHRRWQSWAVLVVGVFSTGLLGALLLLGTGHTRRIQTVVDERTRDLENLNRRLEIEIREREQAEAALRQAQRMEAIGQLTGGIAHDFNNLLMVISGNAAMLADTAQDDRMHRRVTAIMQAAERGERLTRQLLAFSRRQMLRPEPVDLRRQVDEIADMLLPALRDDIEVKFEMPAELWPVFVDLAEFQMALLNLGMNARDAMPESGRFQVGARNITFDIDDPTSGGLVGDFVAVTLSDTGAGMAPEVVARAFEPYFTTKEIGLGSGLGLSQVYGFAQQSGGAVSIASGRQGHIDYTVSTSGGRRAPCGSVQCDHLRTLESSRRHPGCRRRRRGRPGDDGGLARDRLPARRGQRRPCRVSGDRTGSDDRAGVVRHRDAGRNERSRPGPDLAESPSRVAD